MTYDDGRRAFTRHRRCAVLQGHAPAERLSGHEAIRYWFPAEPSTLMQIAQPASQARQEWMRGWDAARADWRDGKDEEIEP